MRELFKSVFRAEPGGISAVGAALFAVCLAAYAVVVSSPPAFDPQYSFYLDTASFYWMRGLWDQGLYGADQLAAFYRHNLYKPCPETLWVWPAAVFIKIAGYAGGLKLLAVCACAAGALMVRRLAMASSARPAAAAAVLLFAVLFLSMDSFFGVPRVYGALVVIGYAWAVEEKCFRLLPFLTALCFGVYPVVAAGLAASSLLVPFFFRSEFCAGKELRRYLAAGALGAVLILTMGSMSMVIKNTVLESSSVGSFESDKLHQMVPAALDPYNPLDALPNFILNFNEHGTLYIIIVALLAAVYALGVLVQPRRPAMLPRSISLLLAGCGTAFTALYPMHPVTASRQLVFVIPLALVFLAAEGVMTIFEERFRPAAAALLCAALFTGLHPFFNRISNMRQYAGVYEFLAARPRGEVVAGHPESELVFTAPVFASQPALLSDGTADQELLFFRSPATYADRKETLLKALYCSDPAAEGRLAGYGVRWMLLEKRYYSPEFLSDLKSYNRLSDAAAVAAGGAELEKCYTRWAGRAVFSWRDAGGGGLAVPLTAPAEGAR